MCWGAFVLPSTSHFFILWLVGRIFFCKLKLKFVSIFLNWNWKKKAEPIFLGSNCIQIVTWVMTHYNSVMNSHTVILEPELHIDKARWNPGLGRLWRFFNSSIELSIVCLSNHCHGLLQLVCCRYQHQHILWAVLPVRLVAAMPDDAVAMSNFFPWDLNLARIKLKRNVFPVPPGASMKKSFPHWHQLWIELQYRFWSKFGFIFFRKGSHLSYIVIAIPL